MWVSSWLTYSKVLKTANVREQVRNSWKFVKDLGRRALWSWKMNILSIMFCLAKNIDLLFFLKYESKSEFEMGNQPLSGIGLTQKALLIRRTFPSTKLNSNFTKVSPLFDLCVEQFLYKFWEFHTISLIKVWNWYWINIT